MFLNEYILLNQSIDGDEEDLEQYEMEEALELYEEQGKPYMNYVNRTIRSERRIQGPEDLGIALLARHLVQTEIVIASGMRRCEGGNVWGSRGGGRSSWVREARRLVEATQALAEG